MSAAAGPVGIGLDVGTSGCRAVAVDAAGRQLAAAARPLPAPLRPGPTRVEQAPALWWRAATAALAEVAAKLGPARRGAPRALCVDATSATVLLCTPQGMPLGPALMYNDRSAMGPAARIDTVAPDHSPVRGVSSSLSKLLTLLERHAPAAPVLALHQADWLIGQLRGRWGDSDWNNALKLGYDPDTECWPGWLHTLLPAPVGLPRVHAPGTPLGPIAAAVAAATGLPEDCLICAGTTDSTAAVLAAGAREPGDAVTSLGSTLVLKLLAEQPVSAPRFGVYSHRYPPSGHPPSPGTAVDGQRLWLVGGASNSGGAVLRQHFDDEALRTLSGQLDPERDSGLDYYPLPAPGERFPIADPTLPPRLTPRPHSDSAFLHGLLEGIARIERDGYGRLTALGAASPRRVLSTGGGAANPTWTRLRARLLGVPVLTAAHADAAFGAACLALEAARGGD